MPCYHPINAYRHPSLLTDTGKQKIVIVAERDVPKHPTAEWLKLPCGQCVGCRIARTKEWAIRCVHEASLYSENAFITLTFNEQNMDRDRSLVKRDFQLFMKRLRKHFSGKDAVDIPAKVDQSTGEILQPYGVHFPIRYFHCGEYGEEFNRPHHHACLFNFDFDDKVLWKIVKGIPLYVSEQLDELWSKEIDAYDCRYYDEDTLFERDGRYYAKLGFCTTGSVTTDSAAYVAGYIHKKINGEDAQEHYTHEDPETGELVCVEPEYTTMSRRPGIGHGFLMENPGDVYPKDFCTSKGKKFKVPRYYDSVYDQFSPDTMKEIKEKRKEVAIAKQASPERLLQMEKCAKANLKRARRSYEK